VIKGLSKIKQRLLDDYIKEMMILNLNSEDEKQSFKCKRMWRSLPRNVRLTYLNKEYDKRRKDKTD
jgi:hypothetical protein